MTSDFSELKFTSKTPVMTTLRLKIRSQGRAGDFWTWTSTNFIQTNLWVNTLNLHTPHHLSRLKLSCVCSLLKARGCLRASPTWFSTCTKALLCAPCWSRWRWHPRCRKAAPGGVPRCVTARRTCICWCRTWLSPRSSSPPCTPSSVCRWAPSGSSEEKIQLNQRFRSAKNIFSQFSSVSG